MHHLIASTFHKPLLRSAALFASLAAVTLTAGGCGGDKAAAPAPAAAAPTAAAPAAPTEAPAAESTPAVATPPAPATAAEPAPPAPSEPATAAEAPKDNVKMSKEFWPNGKLKYTYELRKSSNGKWAKNGIGRAYYDSGKLEREGPYKNNVRVGKWTYYAPDGKVLRTEERGADGKGGSSGEPPLP